MRAIHFEGCLEHGRRIIFLDDLNQQPHLAVFFDEPVARGIVTSHTGQPRQHFVQFLGIDGLALKAFYVTSDVDRLVRVCSLDLDELRCGNIAALACLAHLLVRLPIGIVEGKRFEQPRARTCSLIAAQHDLCALGVIARPEFGQRHGNDRVGPLQAAQLVFLQNRAYGMIQNGEDGLDVLGFGGSALQVHGNDDLRAHLTHDICRQIV